MKKPSYMYIMGNHRPTLYIGVTADLVKRVWQHKRGEVDGFSLMYGLDKLLYFEEYSGIGLAIAREKQLKSWRREWKLDLVREVNPGFRDLSLDWMEVDPESSSG